jgi:two-component system sensor kinase FixL
VRHPPKRILTTIQGFSGMLEQSAARGDIARLKEDINRIHAAADRMETLLNDLLELSRIGRLVNPPTRIPLGDLAREAVDLVAGTLRRQVLKTAPMPTAPMR